MLMATRRLAEPIPLRESDQAGNTNVLRLQRGQCIKRFNKQDALSEH